MLLELIKEHSFHCQICIRPTIEIQCSRRVEFNAFYEQKYIRIQKFSLTRYQLSEESLFFAQNVLNFISKHAGICHLHCLEDASGRLTTLRFIYVRIYVWYFVELVLSGINRWLCC